MISTLSIDSNGMPLFKKNAQLFCVTCGKHYHGSCVGLGSGPGVRTAWQCNECKVCITCRTPVAQQGTGAEAVTDRTKMLVCDTCDKNYHPSCVR